ncbi:peptidoglycan-binding protein LysM [Pseudoxanthomonas kalamensis DSM 18571]|uniref:LysM peptidoglycan-binding domain-containing protein n=1 Tax=Pseudoxanthomonas kalamensis TaxID=289483 RepID=UPI0013915608|nr:LysM peptidoglycan-binding domain-containing protein [Pseudoxanthomonas kalamensis]KAF1712103.1 peptidoglycan-binding protein LysM [Pseudoxanthomonas kalamensis DSM 18571]
MFKHFRTVLAAAALTVATVAVAAEMTDGHPDTYVVKKGDTLWDISARFLKKPWLWPEIWQANPQIQNPHLIYPGDVISLAYLDRVAVQPGPRDEAPIGAIPLSDIEPFLKDRKVVDSFEHLPYVVGLEDNRLRSSNGQLIYALGLDSGQPGQRYAIVRPTAIHSRGKFNTDLDFRGGHISGDDSAWKDYAVPDESSELLGYELAKVGVGVYKQGPVGDADASTLVLEDEGLEVRTGDRLVPVEAQPYDLQFFPHVPRSLPADGQLRVLAVADTFTSAGPRDVIAISGGSREGIDNGTVFSVWRQGSHVKDNVVHRESSRMDDAFKDGTGRATLPDEYAAHAMVFRTFDKVSYALVMEGIKPARVGYELKHPDATY